MPFRFEDARTPRGAPLLVIHASGPVSLKDAEQLAARLAPGAPNHMGLIISYAEKGVEYSPEARKYFPTLNDKYRRLATVVTSPIVRAAINMIMRITGQAPNLRMFSDETEALAWLDAV